MAGEEKPYRTYRGGRAKGKVPSATSRSGRRTADSTGGRRDKDGGSRTDYRGPGARPERHKNVRWGRRVGLGVVVLLLLVLVWAIASWFAFSSGVSDANKRLTPDAKSVLAPQSGLLLSHSTTVLLLGTDNSQIGNRTGDRHSDSILLLRTDPTHHRLYYLSIPRDLTVPIPGYGTQKINAAFQNGGAALAIKTIHDFTGTDINHIVVVNFGDFKDLIDALGGIDVNVPHPIRSNRFDCPYSTAARCSQWQGWRFPKGMQHMNGERALIYSRIRENMLNPAETDVTRGARQQLVMDALASKFTSPSTLMGLPFNGGTLVKPLTTDLSASQLMQLGWVKFRSSASTSVHCRLGGDLGGGGGGSPSEDNPATIAMFLGKSAPQPPTGPFDPGCVTGHTLQ
ncbi:MAG TPA: LCP family protein [Gaiellaceae bacterium]|jgi:LCP family protein required for cell wall assembly|nr:LCP family protein [Gaiellaceae bacterium]